jgi:hypothetical protein
MIFGSRMHPLNVLQFSSTVLPIAFAVLFLGQGSTLTAGLFAIGYGLSIGMNTIARGAVPLALLDPKARAPASALSRPRRSSPRPPRRLSMQQRSIGPASGAASFSPPRRLASLGSELLHFRCTIAARQHREPDTKLLMTLPRERCDLLSRNPNLVERKCL